MKRRRFFKFTLRTALLALIAASVLLGWKANKARRQQKTLAAVRKMGGMYFYEFTLDATGNPVAAEPPGPAWLRNQIGLDFLSDVGRIDIYGTQASDLTPLSGLTNLRWLMLEGTPVSDLAPLAGMTNLRALSLDSTQASDLTPLARMTSLEVLRLCGTDVSDLTPLVKLLHFRGTQAISD